MLGQISMPPRISIGSRMAGKLGSVSSARFTLPEDPRYLKLSMKETKSEGSSFSSTSLRNVTLGSQPDTTIFASISSPLSRVTPTARPSFTRTWATPALQRISAPWLRAALAMVSLTPPVPPSCEPQAVKAPSSSPM
jgi:hypothetical protein